MTTTEDQIWKSLEDKEYRQAFNLDIETGLLFQIRALRLKNGWTLGQLAARVGYSLGTVSRWEDSLSPRYSLTGLKDLAVAFDVALVVRFVPFGETVEHLANLTPERIAPPNFTEEAQSRRRSSGWKGGRGPNEGEE